MELRQEPLPGDDSVTAVLYGPLALAAKLGAGPTDEASRIVHGRPTSPPNLPPAGKTARMPVRPRAKTARSRITGCRSIHRPICASRPPAQPAASTSPRCTRFAMSATPSISRRSSSPKNRASAPRNRPRVRFPLFVNEGAKVSATTRMIDRRSEASLAGTHRKAAPHPFRGNAKLFSNRARLTQQRVPLRINWPIAAQGLAEKLTHGPVPGLVIRALSSSSGERVIEMVFAVFMLVIIKH